MSAARHCLLVCALVWLMPRSAEAADSTWKSTVDIPPPVRGVATADDGFAIVGPARATARTDFYPAYLIKFDPAGEVQWSREFSQRPGGDKTVGCGLAATRDGGYILLAQVNDRWLWLQRLDAAGQLVQELEGGWDMSSGACAVAETSDGGYLVGASDYDGTNLTRLDASGAWIWALSVPDGTGIASIAETADGGAVASGEFDFSAGTWVVKIDAAGTPEWQVRFLGRLVVFDLRQTPDGGYIVVGYRAEAPFPAWALKLRSDGSIEWQNVYAGEWTTVFEGVALTPDGGYLLSGFHIDRFLPGGHDPLVAKLDATGAVVWAGTYYDRAFVESSSGLAAASRSGYFVFGARQILPAVAHLMRIDETGRIGPSCFPDRRDLLVSPVTDTPTSPALSGGALSFGPSLFPGFSSDTSSINSTIDCRTCPLLPSRIAGLRVVRRFAPDELALTWDDDAASSGGYRLYSVVDKRSIPRANLRTPVCAPPAGSAACAFGPTPEQLLFYQVVGVCSDGLTEGPL